MATIFALASGAGRSAVAVMRLSGGGCARFIQALCGVLPQPRQATLRRLRDRNGQVLDRALLLWFPGPASYTGEDCAELHLHGGRAVIAGVSDALVHLGARPAEPGEFTRRAFLNDKMDLLEAEAVADLVAAETAGQRSQALGQLDGTLSRLYDGWAQRLRQVLAWQEALIDFATEDVPAETETELLAEVGRLRAEMGAHLDDGHRGERLRNGLKFVIAGPPNVGKSSLINALAKRDVAIVAPTPGTTRDAIEVHLDLGGIPVTLVDTAGLRDSADFVEAEGIRRSRAHMADCDLVVLVRDATADTDDELVTDQAPTLPVVNKSDLAAPIPGQLRVSALTGAGLDALVNALCQYAADLAAPGATPVLTQARHRAALREAHAALEAAASAPFADLRGEELRLALGSLARLTGAVGVEDLLDLIFRQFCIGK